MSNLHVVCFILFRYDFGPSQKVKYFSFVQKRHIASVMSCKIVIVISCLNFAIASLHLDKVILTGNKLYNEMNYSYYHDEKQNVHINFAIQTKAVASRILVYMKATAAENDLRKGRELMRTVIDFDKLINGLYGNPLISGFIKSFIKDLDNLNLKTPLPAVSCNR